MTDFFIQFAVIACLIVFFRFLKYVWAATIRFAESDIELDSTVPRTMMYLLNFPAEKNARQASKFLGYFFSAVNLEGFLNGRWSVECKRRLKPKRLSFLILNLVVNLAAIAGRGELIFVGAQVND